MRNKEFHSKTGIEIQSVRTLADKVRDELAANPNKRLDIIEENLLKLLERYDE